MTTKLTILTLSLASLLAGCAVGQDVEDQQHGLRAAKQLRRDAAECRITMRQAIEKALAKQRGKACSVELERSKGSPLTFEVMVLSPDGQLSEVRVDAVDGAVQVAAGDESAEEVAEAKAAIGGSKHSMARCIRSAEMLVHGVAVEARLEVEDDEVECQVVLVSGSYLIEVEIDARSGKVGDIELIADKKHDGEEDEEEEGEEEEDGEEEEEEEESEGEMETGREGEAGERARKPAKSGEQRRAKEAKEAKEGKEAKESRKEQEDAGAKRAK